MKEELISKETKGRIDNDMQGYDVRGELGHVAGTFEFYYANEELQRMGKNNYTLKNSFH